MGGGGGGGRVSFPVAELMQSVPLREVLGHMRKGNCCVFRPFQASAELSERGRNAKCRVATLFARVCLLLTSSGIFVGGTDTEFVPKLG